MLQSLVLVLALSGQVPDAYVEVPRPPVVVRQPPKVTLEEQEPLVIPRPPKMRVEPQPSKVIEQEPVRVPVYRLPSPEAYGYSPVFVGGQIFGAPIFVDAVPPGRRGRVVVKETYEYKVRGRGLGLFGR